MTALPGMLGIELPVVQAPMAGVQGSALALAVSNAGGLGSLPAALLGPEALRAELEAMRAGTDRPYNVNFFCHEMPQEDPGREDAWRDLLDPYYRDFSVDPDAMPAGGGRTPFDAHAADILNEFRPPILSFHFGLPSPPLLAQVKSWGARVLSTATTVEEAIWLESRGVDAVIAQGLEAGGHRGHFLSSDLTRQMGTFALVAQTAAVLRIPVIAAGGIADAAGAAAAFALGASAVQVGTAYLLCPEATTRAVHRAALASPAVRHTAITNIFTGRPARAIVNGLMRDLGITCPAAPAFPWAARALAPLRAAAERAGSGDFSPLWAGQNATGCRAIGAAELTRGLMPR
jgi:nitronate monooxygenase